MFVAACHVIRHVLLNEKCIHTYIHTYRSYYSNITCNLTELYVPQFSSCCHHESFYNVQGGSNMTGTDLYVNKPHCAAAVRP